MATDGVEEADYESDPEELKRSLATRRREASDDEDEGLNHHDDKRPGNQRPDIDSDDHSAIVESDIDQPLPLEPEDSYDEDDGYEDCDYAEVDQDSEYIADSVAGKPKALETDGMNGEDAADVVDGEQLKKKEPFAVPTAGAFYMHDDRFQELDAASNRRMRGGRRLWQSRDERKWGHDKYEEMNTQPKQYDRRTLRGRSRGRGQGQGQERGYSRGNYKAHMGNGHQNQFPKTATGERGPRRYEVASRNGNQAPSTKQSHNSFVKVLHVDSEHPPNETASIETAAIQAKKNVSASSLNSASPPFYPSGSSNNLAQKDLQAGMGRLHINENPMPSGKKFGNSKTSSFWVRTTQPSQTTSHGGGAPPPGQVLYQQPSSQGDKVSSPMQIRGMPKDTDQSCGQTFDQHSAVISLLPSSPPKTGSLKKQYLSSEIESATDSDLLIAKGKGSLQPSGRGSYMYAGSQFVGPTGSMATNHGNPDFPAFLPVMQFSGQHGGVPTFGMALPGYVQPEHGTGNPGMTWLPILTGPGALGASYCPPYAAIDGSYQAHKPGLPSSAGSSSQDNNLNDEESAERPEVTNNGNSQRSNSNPNKQPRRYSEMSFSK